jgi:2Fe-2S iron-sulfur cluster binding domain
VSSLLNSFERFVRVTLNGTPVMLPEANTLLRGVQHLAPEDVSSGPFCWNRNCGTCIVEYDMGEGTEVTRGLGCQLLITEGMRIRTEKPMFGYCVRSLVSAELHER